MSDERVTLYKAVKHEANEYYCDHGMKMFELWAVVNYRFTGIELIDYISIDLHDFWKRTCLEDYEREVVK